MRKREWKPRKKWASEVGKKVGRLTIIGVRRVGTLSHFDASCECGGSAVVRCGLLLRGRTKSCGCLQREVAGMATRSKFKKMEGAYKSYMAMHWRNNPNNKQDFKYYKKVGVCPRWRGPSGYSNFLSDMGPRPPELTLDRIDNLKPYSADNCRWATRGEQSRNTRRNHRLIWNGESTPLRVICERLNIRHASVIAGINRRKICPEAALLSTMINTGHFSWDVVEAIKPK